LVSDQSSQPELFFHLEDYMLDRIKISLPALPQQIPSAQMALVAALKALPASHLAELVSAP